MQLHTSGSMQVTLKTIGVVFTSAAMQRTLPNSNQDQRNKWNSKKVNSDLCARVKLEAATATTLVVELDHREARTKNAIEGSVDFLTRLSTGVGRENECEAHCAD